MPQIINTNIASLNSQRNLNASESSLATSLQRLSSGLRINSAKDDAAGLAISTRMTSQIMGLNQAGRNANDAISLAQTAEGGLTTVADALNRIRELAVQSANGTNSATDRAALQAEVLQLTNEIQRVSSTTQFNGLNILDGSLGSAQFQVGANAGQTISFSVGNSQTSAIGNYGLGMFDTTVASTVANAAGAAVSSASTAATANRVSAQTLTLTANGANNTIAITAGATIKSVADSINALTNTTGVSAETKTQATLGLIATAGTISFVLQSSSTASANISATITTTSDLSALATAINAASASTNIFATSNGASITLTNAEGNNIVLGDYTNSSSAAATAVLTGADAFAGTVQGTTTILTAGGTDSAAVAGTFKLNSASVYTVTTSTAAGNIFVTSGLAQASALTAVSSLNIGSLSGATNAIAIVDSALTQISTIRANLGALQNRFSATITNLQTASENASASRSRIQDADFATETTNLSRAQILQQAGIASLAQANAIPNNVLALLQ